MTSSVSPQPPSPQVPERPTPITGFLATRSEDELLNILATIWHRQAVLDAERLAVEEALNMVRSERV